jgi:hypothetical protein
MIHAIIATALTLALMAYPCLALLALAGALGRK